jgi:hypothetical protein
MKRIVSTFLTITVICSLATSAFGQTSTQRGRRGRVAALPTNNSPAITIISDRELTRYKTERNGDAFAITIYDVGSPRILSFGQAFEQRPQGNNDLVISFVVDALSNPRLEQAGNQLNIFFKSSDVSSQAAATQFATPPVNPFEGQVRRTFPAPPADEQRMSRTLGSNAPFGPIEPLQITLDPVPTLPRDNPCEAIEEPLPQEGDGFVVIDANTGKILEGSTRVSEDTRVKVAFVNKNPFKYDYSFQLVPKDVGGATIVSFLGLIPGIPSIPGFLEGTIEPAVPPAVSSALKSSARKAATARDRAAADECPSLITDVDTALANSEKIAQALNAKTALLKKSNESYTKFIKATDKTFDRGLRDARTAFYKRLCNAGSDALPTMEEVAKIDFDEFSKSLKLTVFSANLTVLEDQAASATCSEKDRLKAIISALKTKATEFNTKHDALKKAVADTQKAFEGPIKIIKTVLGSPSTAFAEAAYAPSLGDATSVSITITRKNLREENPKDETIAVSRPIEIGEPRVVLSGGLGFSTINERTIIRQQSLVPGPSGTTVVGNRFGFENRSQFRPSGLILIHGLLKRFSLFGDETANLALSGGLVFSNRDDGLATEFVAGPSFAFARNKVFLTLGFHAARVQQLGGDFKIGDPVPADLTDPLPVQKNWSNGLMMGLTFKIQPK